MLSSLKNHPFAVEAFFKTSLVLTFAAPKEQVQLLVPECLQLDTFNNEWAFIAVAMVQTRHLRPKGFPEMLGNNFFLVGYRVFVRFTNEAGKSLRGLYILKSETDKKKMSLFGNIFTHYKYTTTDIQQNTHDGATEIHSAKSAFALKIEEPADEDVTLPAGSPFNSWKEARRYAGPLPFTFTYNQSKHEVLVIEGVREHWEPKPVKVIDQRFAFIETLGLKDARLANAFIIHDIPYYWKKGKIEKWNRKEDPSRAS